MKQLLFILLFLPAMLRAQQFDILESSGHVQLFVKNGTPQWQKLPDPGRKLKGGDLLKIGKGGKIVLKNNAGDVIICQLAGTHKVSDLDKKSRIKKGSKLHSYYMDYIWKELTAHAEDPSKDPKKNMKVIGGVSRGEPKQACYLCLHPENDAVLTGDTITFFWCLINAQPNFPEKKLIIVMPVDSDQLYTSFVQFECRDSICSVPRSQLKLEKDKVYAWFATHTLDSMKGYITMKNRFTIASDSTLARLKANEPKKFEGSSEMMHTLMLASYYKSHKVYSIAKVYYRKAAELDPGNSAARLLYMNFLENCKGY